MYCAILYFIRRTTGKTDDNSQGGNKRKQYSDVTLLYDIVRVFLCEILFASMKQLQMGNGDFAMNLLNEVSMYVPLLEKTDKVYRFCVKYSDRIVDGFKKSRKCADQREAVKNILKNIKKQLPIENLNENRIPDELKNQFLLIEQRDEEFNIEEKEFSPENLSFRYYNLLNNFDATRTVS